MKIKEEQYRRLEWALHEVMVDKRDYIINVIIPKIKADASAGRVGHKLTRFVWDIVRLLPSDFWQSWIKDAYTYANDEHVETVLKRIILPYNWPI